MSAAAPHLVVDVRLARAGGHRTYLHNVVPRIARLRPEWRWTLIGDPNDAPPGGWSTERVTMVPCDAPMYSVREQMALPRHVPRNATLYWAPHYNVPLAVRMPMFVTIHDLAHVRLREYTSKPLRYAYAKAMLRVAVAKAASIVCVSEFSRRELAAEVGQIDRPVDVVHHGIVDEWFAAEPTPSPVEPPYFVFVGSLKPHKNVRALLAAFRSLPAHLAERLVIADSAFRLETEDADVVHAIQEMGGRVLRKSKLSDVELRALVRHATALVQPSTYEGFGLPPLEAMAAGVPVIASRSASLPEVCGDAAVYFDASDVTQLGERLLAVASDASMRADLSTRGRARARTFTWDDSARGTLAALERTVPLTAV